MCHIKKWSCHDPALAFPVYCELRGTAIDGDGGDDDDDDDDDDDAAAAARTDEWQCALGPLMPIQDMGLCGDCCRLERRRWLKDRLREHDRQDSLRAMEARLKNEMDKKVKKLEEQERKKIEREDKKAKAMKDKKKKENEEKETASCCIVM